MREHDDAEAGEGGWVRRLGGDFVVRLLSGLAMGAGVALFTLSGPTPFALMVVAVSLVVSWEWGRLVHGPDAGILVAVQLGSAAVAGLLATFLSSWPRAPRPADRSHSGDAAEPGPEQLPRRDGRTVRRAFRPWR